jgi:hypothetical protein
MKSNQYKIVLLVSIFLLGSILLYWTRYLVKNGYIMECFREYFTSRPISEKYDGSTSHTVNLPLTNAYSCKNFCGPTSRCSVTGQQCFSDVDCPGCKPNIPANKNKKNNEVPGDNDSGKLTWGITPQYSNLTSNNLVRNSTEINSKNARPPMANFGIDDWTDTANIAQQLFDQRYKPPNNLEYMPLYEKIYSATGLYASEEPLPSNY